MDCCISCGTRCNIYVACFNCRNKVCSDCRAGGALCTECADVEKSYFNDHINTKKTKDILSQCSECCSKTDYRSIKRLKELFMSGSILRAEALMCKIKPRLTDNGLFILNYLERICLGYDDEIEISLIRDWSKYTD